MCDMQAAAALIHAIESGYPEMSDDEVIEALRAVRWFLADRLREAKRGVR
jgi:hypothetical protein